jgi:hypothetical protein
MSQCMPSTIMKKKERKRPLKSPVEPKWKVTLAGGAQSWDVLLWDGGKNEKEIQIP